LSRHNESICKASNIAYRDIESDYLFDENKKDESKEDENKRVKWENKETWRNDESVESNHDNEKNKKSLLSFTKKRDWSATYKESLSQCHIEHHCHSLLYWGEAVSN